MAIMLFKRGIRAMVALASFFLLLFAAYAAFGFYAEPRAEQAARGFCSRVQPGDDPRTIGTHATEAGASERALSWTDDGKGQKTLFVTFTGLPPFSRHICTIVANETVVSATYSHLD